MTISLRLHPSINPHNPWNGYLYAAIWAGVKDHARLNDFNDFPMPDGENYQS